MSEPPIDPGRRGPSKPRSPRPDPDDTFDLGPEPSTFRPNPVPPRQQSPHKPQSASASTSKRAAPTADSHSSARAKTNSEPEPTARGLTLRFGRVTAGQLAMFCRQLGVYLDSGVGLERALASLYEQTANTPLGPIAERFRQAVKRGEPVSEAAQREPQVFDTLFLSMVRVAEERGGLPETLKRLASLYEARDRLWKQTRSAMIYPTAVILVSLGVGALLTMFVLPKLVDILKDMTRGRNIDLPWPTRTLIGVSDFIQAVGWWLIPLGLVLGLFGLKALYGSPHGKWLLDRIMLRIPVMGKLLGLIDSSRFARTLGDLLNAGINLDRSLALTSEVVQLVPFQDAVRQIRESVKAGSEVAPAMRETRRFEPDLIAFVETGEETGNLPESLRRVAKDYEERAHRMTQDLGSLIKPLITIVLGVIAGFIAIALILAYISILASAGSGL